MKRASSGDNSIAATSSADLKMKTIKVEEEEEEMVVDCVDQNKLKGAGFSNLDDNLIFEVFKHVDARTLGMASCVSKQWHKTAEDERLWELILTRLSGIFQCAVEGNALKAIELTEELAPELLEKNKDLHFDLLSLHFVELVRAEKCTEALEFAQNKLCPFGKVDKYFVKLYDCMALLAYEEPEKSSLSHLLSLDYRQQVADSLNQAILGHSNLARLLRIGKTNTTDNGSKTMHE